MSKRKLSFADLEVEDVEDAPDVKLFEFLLSTGNGSKVSSICKMFNTPMDLNSLLQSLSNRFMDLLEVFLFFTRDHRVDNYVHFSDVVKASNMSLSSSCHKWKLLGDDVKRILEKCEWHVKGNCQLLEKDIAVLIFFQWISESLPKSKAEGEVERAEAEAEEVDDGAEEFQKDQEERRTKRIFDIAKFKSQNLTKVEQNINDDDDMENPLQAIPTFPSYRINNKDYVLLNDIQHLYDLREDYCLAILAKWGQNDKDFIDSSVDPISALDTQCDDFIDKASAGQYFTDLCVSYESKGLPSEEEFQEIQRRLNIQDMGFENAQEIVPQESQPKNSLNLHSAELIENDENPQIDIEDPDKFLGRAKGSRPMALGRNQSLGHYIGDINPDTVIIYHNKFSTNPEVPFLALKALSRVVGSQPLHRGVDKIILVEKQEAIRVFGYMPGVVASRAAYYATLGAYVLAHTGSAENMKKLGGYRKQELLKSRGQIEWEIKDNTKEEEGNPSSSQAALPS